MSLVDPRGPQPKGVGTAPRLNWKLAAALFPANDGAAIGGCKGQLAVAMNTVDGSDQMVRRSALDSAMVNVAGRGWGVDFTLDDEAPYLNLEESLRRHLKESHGWFTGGAVTVNVGRRVLDQDQLRRIKDLFEGEFQVDVARFWCRSEAVERAISQESGVPVGIVTHRPSPVSAQGDFSPPEPPLLIKGTCRSGSNIHHNGDVVVRGDINPGAQVTATGDIVVLGTLRGIAHAGAPGASGAPGGDPGVAVIIAMVLRPIQLRIGSHITVPPADKRRRQAATRPEIAYISGNSIVVAPFIGDYEGNRGRKVS